MKTIDLTPTHEGFVSMFRLFTEQAATARANAKRAGKFSEMISVGMLRVGIYNDDDIDSYEDESIDNDDMDLIQKALDEYSMAEVVRAGDLDKGAAEAQRGIEWYDAGCPRPPAADVREGGDGQ